MYLLAAALAFANSPQNRPIVHAGATAQAIATVRIISGAVIHLGEGPRGRNGPWLRIPSCTRRARFTARG